MSPPEVDPAGGFAGAPGSAAVSARDSPVSRTFRAFTYRDYRLLWAGAFLSSVGTWMQEVAQNWLILTMTGSAFLLGLDAFLGDAPFLAFSLFGLGVWLREFTSPRHQLFTVEGSFLLGLLALILLQVLAITVHEAGHALAIRHYGRRVRQLGVALYYLFPCVYVDSTDMTLASRRQRVVVSPVRSPASPSRAPARSSRRHSPRPSPARSRSRRRRCSSSSS